jgi:hypothetical protein
MTVMSLPHTKVIFHFADGVCTHVWYFDGGTYRSPPQKGTWTVDNAKMTERVLDACFKNGAVQAYTTEDWEEE